MKLMFKLNFVLFFLAAIFSSCDKETVTIEGMAPVYIDPLDFTMIKSIEAQPFEDLGKIVYDGKFIFINEKFKGIHIVDNTDPSNPKNIRFLQIPGNTQFTITNNILYADNSIHLLVIDISNIYDIKVLNYVENVYLTDDSDDYYPPDYNGYFECVDKKKGIVVGWEKKLIVDPLCFAH
ncbi:MAG TPA: hypothetical protein ENK91_11395 [Bacteroidetes bacterium]|nr:hypothetical protein [Bacteroidota bacterium]